MRINRYLALCGFGSRRAVEGLILSGAVTVNGQPATDLSLKVTGEERVEVLGRPARPPREHAYVMLNKPAGYLCSRSDPQGRRLIYDLLPERFRGLHYVGRLDYPSRGLILLTTDGELTHSLLHPGFEVPRTYRVWTRDPLEKQDLQALRQGVEIEPGHPAVPAAARMLADHLEITLKEGKKREIRRMLEVLGHKVVDLQRIRFGGLELGDLPEGSHRVLSVSEVARLHGKKDK